MVRRSGYLVGRGVEESPLVCGGMVVVVVVVMVVVVVVSIKWWWGMMYDEVVGMMGCDDEMEEMRWKR